MSSKLSYALIIILSIAVIVLGVLVGFFYGQTLNFTEKTITQTLTTTQPKFQTVTNTITITKTSATTTTATTTSIKTVTATVTTISTMTGFEKLEITNTFVARNTNDYTITISYKNSGSTDITIEIIFVGEKPLSTFWSIATVNGIPMSNIYVPQGSSGKIVVIFPDNGSVRAFVAGQMVEMKVQTSSGVYYIGSFNMP